MESVGRLILRHQCNMVASTREKAASTDTTAAAGSSVMDVRGHKHVFVRTAASFHASQDDGRVGDGRPTKPKAVAGDIAYST